MAAPLTSKHRSGLSAHVLKVMGMFSGVQIVAILCSIVRTKLVALWLGPAGVGLIGIFLTSFDTVAGVAQSGTIGVTRELAMAPKSALARLVAVVRRWGWGLGLAGMLICVALSPLLSSFSFENYSHTFDFMLVGVAILFACIYNMEGAVMQGTGALVQLGRSTIAGGLLGLALSIPLYYFWGLASIAPAILVAALSNWIVRRYMQTTYPLTGQAPGVKETIVSGKSFAVLGMFIAVTSFASNIVSYIFMTYLNREAGVETAGYFQAGFTVVNRYVGIVLAAVGTEFLPRLSKVSMSPRRAALFITHETILVLLVMFPLITLFICCDELIVRLLYDSRFLVMLPFITWAIVGTVFRAWSWCLAVMILARGDGRAYLLTEIFSALAYLGLNVLFYEHFSIAGMGYAYALWFLLYLAIVWAVCYGRYHIVLRSSGVLVPLGILAVSVAAALLKSMAGWWAAVPFVLLSFVVCVLGMERLLGMNMADLMKKFVGKTKKS